MLDMLTTLMDITEAESGTMPLQRDTVGLAGVAARAIDLYRDVAEAKGVSLTAHAAVGAMVAGDRCGSSRWRRTCSTTL